MKVLGEGDKHSQQVSVLGSTLLVISRTLEGMARRAQYLNAESGPQHGGLTSSRMGHLLKIHHMGHLFSFIVLSHKLNYNRLL